MPTRAAEQLLYDSEATLRLVDNVLDEFHRMEAEDPRSGDEMRLLCTQVRGARAGADLPEVLREGYVEIQATLASLKQSRSVLQRTAERESPAADAAPAQILDGLDRMLALVDRADSSGEGAARTELLAQLRDELFAVMAKAQVQDVARQQLSYATSILLDMEQRLVRLAEVFEPGVGAD